MTHIIYLDGIQLYIWNIDPCFRCIRELCLDLSWICYQTDRRGHESERETPFISATRHSADRGMI